MAQKPITMLAGAFGHAEGKTPLNAFDNALLAAGIGNVNLLKISSIVPPNTRIIALPRIKPGSIIPMAYGPLFGPARPGASSVARVFGSERHDKNAESEHGDKRPHAGAHASSLISASACSSQYRMSISRYIVVAVVRCSRASCRLPVRR